jgi:hypothetical protein
MTRLVVISSASIGAAVCIFSAIEARAASNGLLVTVVNKGDQGVESEIYARSNTSELKVGTTDLHGKLSDSSYQCSGDKNLIAKPVDRTYFDSPLEPCKSPQKILVISRLTPKGTFAFDGVVLPFLDTKGKSAVVSYSATLQTTMRDVKAPAFLPVNPSNSPGGVSLAGAKGRCELIIKSMLTKVSLYLQTTIVGNK